MTTPRIWRFGFGRLLIFSIVSRRSSVPSSAKYDDWIGMMMWLDATIALTVIIPSVGGVSIRMAS